MPLVDLGRYFVHSKTIYLKESIVEPDEKLRIKSKFAEEMGITWKLLSLRPGLRIINRQISWQESDESEARIFVWASSMAASLSFHKFEANSVSIASPKNLKEN